MPIDQWSDKRVRKFSKSVYTLIGSALTKTVGSHKGCVLRDNQEFRTFCHVDEAENSNP